MASLSTCALANTLRKATHREGRILAGDKAFKRRKSKETALTVALFDKLHQIIKIIIIIIIIVFHGEPLGTHLCQKVKHAAC